MRKSEFESKIFIPSDVQRVADRIRYIWTKLSDQDIDLYLSGKRDELLKVLQMKYAFTQEQADATLSSIERLTNGC